MGKAVDSRRLARQGRSTFLRACPLAAMVLAITLWGQRNEAAPILDTPPDPSARIPTSSSFGLAPPYVARKTRALALVDFDVELARPRDWRLIAGKHWQIASPPGEDPSVTDSAEGNRGSCARGMV